MLCPACETELRVETAWLEGLDEVLCGRCASLALRSGSEFGT
jgi:Zn-finger nucleic acid-binding protein